MVFRSMGAETSKRGISALPGTLQLAPGVLHRSEAPPLANMLKLVVVALLAASAVAAPVPVDQHDMHAASDVELTAENALVRPWARA